MAAHEAIDNLPGFRRRILIRPEPGRCTLDLEDDYHRMKVVVEHVAGVATAIASDMARYPWTVCPGARAQLTEGFVGQKLVDFVRLSGRATHCTHLYDLTLLAAAHIEDKGPTIIDIVVSDPVGGRRGAVLRRNGAVVLGWSLQDGKFVDPPAIAGLWLHELRVWIDQLEPGGQEAARLLRWATMLAHGRLADPAAEIDPKSLPRGTCFTFQDACVPEADKRTVSVKDFAPTMPGPLATLTERNGTINYRPGV